MKWGLALLWKGHVDLSLRSWTQNHFKVDCLNGEGHASWRMVCIYEHLEDKNKWRTWDLIKSLHTSPLPWLCLSDFKKFYLMGKSKGATKK